MRDFLEEAKKMISIPSVSPDGNEELANWLVDRMRLAGLKTQFQPVTHSLENVSKRQFNVIGILGDPLVNHKIKRGLLLNTHIDTVGPGLLSNWTECDGNPFHAVIKGDRLYGLGSADVKLDFLCKLRAIEKFRDKKLKHPIYLVGTCGEEIGMFGAKYLIQSKALNPKFVLVGEPSDLSVVYAHKSLNIFKATIGFQMVAKDARGFNRRIVIESFGKSAHGSYPHLGVNAIHQLMDLIRDSIEQGYEMKFVRFEGGETVNKVPDRASAEFYLTAHQFEDYKRFFRDLVSQTGMDKSFRLEAGGGDDVGIRFIPDSVFECAARVSDYFRKISIQFAKIVDPTFNPAHSTVNFGQMKQTINGLEMFLDLRILPDQSAEEIEKEVLKEIRTIASDYPTLNVTAAKQRGNAALGMTLDHELVKICKDAMLAAGLPVKLDKKATSTEAALYFKAGYEAIIFGPGLSVGNSHSPNEFQLLDHLDSATAFYEKVIERVCL
ncbi:MAG: M20/M25/M40 family metallo-hydrolase [Cryobacterium sp.]|nr:M20/M25/M40 family metallo-hydrolase [Oligoflexia bacterium]